MNIEFILDERIDNSGTVEYTARLADAYDADGIPHPNYPKGLGASPYEAIANLCEFFIGLDLDTKRERSQEMENIYG